MTVVAIDISLTATGVAVRSPDRRWNLATIGEDSPGPGPRAQLRRMNRVADGTKAFIFDHVAHPADISLIVMEAPAFSRGTGMAHERAGLWWFIYRTWAASLMPILVVEPNLRIKYALGKGVGGKDAVMLAAARRYPDAPITNNNEADAVVLNAMGCRYLGYPIEASLPATHISAMKTLCAT